VTRIRVSGAEHLEGELEQMLHLLVLLFGNGLEGDVRLEGENTEAVEALRGLVRGVGACRPIDAPLDSPLARPGDECYRQHAEARVFLCPRPWSKGSPRA